MPGFGGTAQVARGLRLHAPNAGGLGSLPGQGTLHATAKTEDPCMLQLRPGAAY